MMRSIIAAERRSDVGDDPTRADANHRSLEESLLIETGNQPLPILGPGIGLRTSLIEVYETENSRRMLLSSFPKDFDVDVLVHPYEADKSVAAENRHYRDMPGILQSLLKAGVDT